MQTHSITPGVVVGITGASGSVYGIRMLLALKEMQIQTHLILSESAEVTLKHETAWEPAEVRALATHCYDPGDLAAPIASGSYPTLGMVIAPCSIKTLSAVATSFADTLVSRAADVTLKEGRRLVLVVREAPLHLGHLRLMVQATELGAVIFPPIPAFYGHPDSIDKLIDESVGRILARLGVENVLYTRWRGPD